MIEGNQCTLFSHRRIQSRFFYSCFLRQRKFQARSQVQNYNTFMRFTNTTQLASRSFYLTIGTSLHCASAVYNNVRVHNTDFSSWHNIPSYVTSSWCIHAHLPEEHKYTIF